jgi:DNA-binding transcriptional ArsR family regulator
MGTADHARLEARARILKSLAHPSRLLIVHELARGPRCVAELTALVGADMSTVSKHLALLKSAGVLADERRGAQIYYALRVPCILNFFGCIEAVIDAQANAANRLTRSARRPSPPAAHTPGRQSARSPRRPTTRARSRRLARTTQRHAR